jgi:hypothetical protein
MDPLTNAYLKVIEESAGVVDSDVQINKTFGKKENEKNTRPAIGGPEEVDGLEKPEEAEEHLSVSSEPSELKGTESLTLKKEAKNPFDALYNKILSEDAFDFSTDDNTLTPDSNFGGPEGIGNMGGEELEDELGEEEMESEEEAESLEDLVSQLRDLLGKLESYAGLGDEESEEEMGEEFPEDSREDGDDSSTDEDDDLNEESVEAEELGHALVDQEKLESGLTKKSSICVKGAVPVTRKGATVEKGKKATGKPENHSPEGGVSKLTGKDNKVPAVQVGKELFNQG